jgi:hypothetical protein
MGPFLKIKNVGRAEGIFRSGIGIILLILAFLITGGLRWALGIIGVAFILTSIFGY